MVATSTAVQPKLQKRQFWITDAALTNWREKVKNFPAMDNELLASAIDEMVIKALSAEKVETIVDGDENARLVHIGEGNDRYFALVKKSINQSNGDHAVVTIMTASQVEKKKQTQWSKPGEALPIERRSEPVIPTGSSAEASGYLMITYIHKKHQGKLHTPDHREYEEWNTAEEVERRLLDLVPNVISGTLRVYEQRRIGFRLL